MKSQESGWHSRAGTKFVRKAEPGVRAESRGETKPWQVQCAEDLGQYLKVTRGPLS